MSILKIKNKIRKTEKRIKMLESTNPKMAKRLKGQLAAWKGRKSNG